MRIFLSYGHDANEVLVRRIKADLELRGHDVWFDHSEIKAGHDWRRTIADGLITSDGVLSFLSKHSIRDPGVCLDEIGIAVGVKGGNVQTILVENESDVSPPPTVSHIQWLDMHDWLERQQAGGAEWENWYQTKLTEIVAVIESDIVRRFAGEIQQLQSILKPIASDPRILELIGKPFIGRDWVLDGLELWRTSSDRKSRMFWIAGGPGTGKSAFAAHLAHFGRDKVIAAVFCEYDKPDHRDPKHIFRSLAFQIATRLPDYRKFLVKLLTEDRYELDRKSASELFDDLLAKPLRHAIDGGRQRYLIILDGLDEAGQGGRNELVSMLARHVPRLPEWLGIVATSRPESSVTAPLKGLSPFVLDTSNEPNQRDLLLYLRGQLASYVTGRSDAEELLKQICELSEGVFLYAEQFCREVQLGHISLDDPDSFPEGLGGIYHQFFERQFPDVEIFEQHIRPMLNLVVARRGPISVELLADVLDISDTEMRRRLQSLGSLFSIDVRDEAGMRQSIVSPFHKSLDDWLTGVDADNGYNLAGEWAADREQGEQHLARFGWNRFREFQSTAPYFMSHLISHLLSARMVDEASQLVLDLNWLEASVRSGRTFRISSDFAAIIERVADKDVRTVLMLVEEAVRSELYFIASTWDDYPQGLMQTLVNYLSPLLEDSSTIPTTVACKLKGLLDDWITAAKEKGWKWLRLEWLDREKVYLGPLMWHSPMRERSPDRLALSPSGEFIAAAAKLHSFNRADLPAAWPESYAITVWSTANGEVISQLFPDANSVELIGPPEDIPRPPELDERFRKYFEHVNKKREAPEKPIYGLNFSNWEKPKFVDNQIDWNVGQHWLDALVAGDVESLAWVDDKTLVAGCRGGHLFGWDVLSGKHVIAVHQSNVDSDGEIHDWNETKVMAMARVEGERLAIGNSFGDVQLVSLKAETTKFVQPTTSCKATDVKWMSMAFDSNQKKLAVGTVREIKIFDANTLALTTVLSGHSDSVTGLAWSPNGRLLASVGWDKKLRLWDVASGKEVWEAIEHPFDLISVVWGTDERILFTAWNQNGDSGSIREWDVETGKCKSEFGHDRATLINSLAMDRKTGRLFAGGKDGTVRCYAHSSKGARVSPVVSHKARIRNAALSARLKLIATVASDGVATWSVVDGKRVSYQEHEWSDYVGWDTEVRFSPDSNYLAVAMGPHLYMLDPKDLILIWTENCANVESCWFSSDSKYFVTDDGKAPDMDWVDKGKGAVVWDVVTGEVVRRSGETGLDAVDWVREQEAKNALIGTISRDPQTSHTALKWGSSHFINKQSGFTELEYAESADGDIHKLRLPSLIQQRRLRFQLDGVGQWILIMEGGVAPIRASVVFPEPHLQ